MPQLSEKTDPAFALTANIIQELGPDLQKNKETILSGAKSPAGLALDLEKKWTGCPPSTGKRGDDHPEHRFLQKSAPG